MSFRVESKVGEKDAEIFEMHQMLLQDLDFEDTVRSEIKDNHYNAEYAVQKAGRSLADMFAAMEGNDYMQQRSADFIDISNRVIEILQNRTDKKDSFSEPVILMAEDLSPSETIQMDTSHILSFVTAKGSVSSHTAILARSLGVTAVVSTGRKPTADLDGHECIADGIEGVVYIDPDEETIKEYTAKKNEYESARELQQALLEEKTALEGELNELREQNGDANETLQSWKVWKESLEATLAG